MSTAPACSSGITASTGVATASATPDRMPRARMSAASAPAVTAAAAGLPPADSRNGSICRRPQEQQETTQQGTKARKHKLGCSKHFNHRLFTRWNKPCTCPNCPSSKCPNSPFLLCFVHLACDARRPCCLQCWHVLGRVLHTQTREGQHMSFNHCLSTGFSTASSWAAHGLTQHDAAQHST